MSSPVLWYATRATGITALVLLSATMVLGAITAGRRATWSWPGFAQQRFHRNLSLVTLLFVAGHVLTSVVDTYVDVGWASVAVPFLSPYRRLAVAVGTVGLDLLVAVTVSSLLRHRMSARTWRTLHWLVYPCWTVAVLHAIAIGTDTGTPWVLALIAFCIVVVTGAVLWRVVREVRATGRSRAVLAGAVAAGTRPKRLGELPVEAS